MLLRAKTSCSSSNSNTSTTSSKRFDKRFLYSNAESRRRLTLVVFHGINIDKEELVLDGSEAPVRTEAETLLASEKLALAATLSKITIPYQPVAAELCSLPTDRDKLPSDKRILTLKLTNASDALDKLIFLSVTEPSLLGDAGELQIHIKPDPENGTITIS